MEITEYAEKCTENKWSSLFMGPQKIHVLYDQFGIWCYTSNGLAYSWCPRKSKVLQDCDQSGNYCYASNGLAYSWYPRKTKVFIGL
jgi:hypothetical protein